jgi:hypothetical protein
MANTRSFYSRNDLGHARIDLPDGLFGGAGARLDTDGRARDVGFAARLADARDGDATNRRADSW